MLLTLIDCDAGLDPPAVAVNDRLAGETASTGAAGFTVRLTSMVFGEPVAPDAATVIVVL